MRTPTVFTALAALSLAAAGAPVCKATSGATAPVVVELYTS